MYQKSNKHLVIFFYFRVLSFYTLLLPYLITLFSIRGFYLISLLLLYIGSTKNKYLCKRQIAHNQNLNKNCNSYLYKFCREHNVKKIICELIETVDNSELKLLEQEYINMLEPTLNTRRAFQTEKQKIEQQQKHTKINNKIKSNCPICNKEMLKIHINRHIKRKH